MITDEKISALRKRLRRGEPAGEIREALLMEGYSKEDIDKVFAPKPYDMRSWYLLFALLLCIPPLFIYARGKILWPFGFPILLFIQYFREVERLKRERSRAEEDKMKGQAAADN